MGKSSSKIKNFLVSEYLEFMSDEVFNKYGSIIRNYIKDKPGIYALYKDNKLVYVGLASDMLNRLKTHRIDRHSEKWDRFSIYLTTDSEHLRELEALLLRVAMPKSNFQTSKFTNAENLEKKLKADIKEYQQKEREYLFKGNIIDEEELADEVTTGGRTPILEKYIKKFRNGLKIRMEYKKQIYTARVQKNGKIHLKGKVFTSPSLAAVEISGHPMDGWHCWKYEKTPGHWVKLDELRK